MLDVSLDSKYASGKRMVKERIVKNALKTFRRCPEHFLNVLCTFSLLTTPKELRQ